MKQCFKCKRDLPMSDFYRHPQMGDGHLGKCKDCTKADVSYRERWLRRTNPEWVARERQRCVAKQTLYNVVAERKWPYKLHARRAVALAIRRGAIKKPGHCQRCGLEFPKARIHAHHDDYARPLDVTFVCAACHTVLDGRARQD